MELYKDVQSSSQNVTATANMPTTGCPSCHPTNSVKALKGTALYWKVNFNTEDMFKVT